MEKKLVVNKKDIVRLMFISDTHLGLVHDRLDLLYECYEKAYQKKIDMVFHCGDLIEGDIMTKKYIMLDKKDGYKKWNTMNESIKRKLKYYTYEEQVNYVIERYPDFSGFGHTYAVAGNHDLTLGFPKKNVVEDVSLKRRDIVYLGKNEGDFKVGNISIKLYHKFHNRVAFPYQKLSTREKPGSLILSDLSDKPDILVLGHLHLNDYYERYNSHVIQCSCLFENPNKRNNVGYYIATLYLDQDQNLEDIEVEYNEFDNKNKVRTLTKQMNI